MADWGALIGGLASSYGAGGGGGGGGGGWQKYIPLIVAGASAAGALAKGKEKGRETENKYQGDAALFKQADIVNAERALENRANIDLAQRGFAQDSQNNAYKNMIRAALMKNYVPVSLDRPAGVPRVKFDLGQGFGPEGKEAADLLLGKARESLMKGESFDKLPPIERSLFPQYKGPGAGENILGAIGTMGSVYSNMQGNARNQAMIDALMGANAQPPLVGSTIPGAQPGYPAPDVQGTGGIDRALANLRDQRATNLFEDEDM